MTLTRTEKDFLGKKKIPIDCYYGVQTQRAVENFSISGVPIASIPELVTALAQIKKAAAIANAQLGMIPSNIADAIIKACDEIILGKFRDQFVVDVYQGGAGTSTNMNTNEIIANRALEILGESKGSYTSIHPNKHVNCSQSTNDVYPTALRLATYTKISHFLIALEHLKSAFYQKGNEFSDVIKMGRTQLQDAVPMTLGQEFHGYATTIGEDILRVSEVQQLLLEINLGATAIGTGINTPAGYKDLVTEKLCEVTGLRLATSENLIEATWDTGVFVQVSSVLKRVAIKLSKICNDLRLLSSGPRTGFNEINLPQMQPGSSIMPGKVNPVIPELVNQIAYQVVGSDVTISMASENGQLELNAMEPVILYNLSHSLHLLKHGCITLADKCVVGITANREHCRNMVENSIGIITALNPIIGYEQACEIAQKALFESSSVYDIVLDRGLLSKGQLDELLTPENMT